MGAVCTYWNSSGNEIGETATHASVFAQLITPDGVNHGLHNFLVPIRDPLSLKPYPGWSTYLFAKILDIMEDNMCLYSLM